MQATIRRHQLERAGEQEIAHQHTGLVAEHGIGTGKAAPKLAAIHHIIMQQRCGVDELDAGRQSHVTLPAGIAAEPCARQGQDRPQPLAAGRHQMGREPRDQLHFAMHVLDDDGIAGEQIVMHQTGQNRQGVAGGVAWRSVGPGGG